MAIYGIGTDIVRIARIEESLQKLGQRFAEKILGQEEYAIYLQRQASSEAKAIRFLATRFSAKEAFSKALGTGFRAPVSWHGVQIVNEANGKPLFQFDASTADWMHARALNAHVSLSDEQDYAVSFVTIEQSTPAVK